MYLHKNKTSLLYSSSFDIFLQNFVMNSHDDDEFSKFIFFIYSQKQTITKKDTICIKGIEIRHILKKKKNFSNGNQVNINTK